MMLREGSEADIGFIMAVEQLPGYAPMIGQWDRQAHVEEMARPGSVYLIAEEAGARLGFANLQKLDDPNGNIYLNRFAVREQGAGIGARALNVLQDWVFAHPHAYRLHLHFSEENRRAARLYARAGFQDEGIERQVYLLPAGRRVDTFRVSILRPEWEKLRGM